MQNLTAMATFGARTTAAIDGTIVTRRIAVAEKERIRRSGHFGWKWVGEQSR